jgi:2-methylisocitrate lyase-like PEP mutase family enzyme
MDSQTQNTWRVKRCAKKIQNVVRQANLPVVADGDTGYGSPMDVTRRVECYASAGAAGIIIEDQTWPKSKLTKASELGFCVVAYPWTLVAAKLESIRETLENLKSMTVGVPPTIQSYSEVCEGIGFKKY